MRANFKKALKIGFLGLMITGILIPIWIFAQDSNSNNQKAQGFCNLISNLASKYDQRLANRETKLEEKRTEIEDKISQRWEERDKKLAEKRDKWDANRDKHFAKLEEKAITDEQKQALLVFKQAVTIAIAARRTAVDEAIKNFRQSVEQTKINRKTEVDNLLNSFQNAIKAAFEKAETDCANDVPPVAIRSNFQAEVRTAKDKFNTDKQELEKLQTAMETLINTKREDIKKAIDDFKAAMEAAKTEFKAVFPPESPESSEPPTT